ncbi:MAG: hypothetical protein ACTH5W_04350 [Providencia sp.]|uniref:hypothetical protein n=1 Tax=Providencia sp. TaxID=589 RepID=UPI003F94ACEF
MDCLLFDGSEITASVGILTMPDNRYIPRITENRAYIDKSDTIQLRALSVLREIILKSRYWRDLRLSDYHTTLLATSAASEGGHC